MLESNHLGANAASLSVPRASRSQAGRWRIRDVKPELGEGDPPALEAIRDTPAGADPTGPATTSTQSSFATLMRDAARNLLTS